MAESSLRAARPERKGGLPNAIFLVAAAEQLPPDLAGVADSVQVLFPWGSLLRAALARPEAEVASVGLAGLVRPGGQVRILLSVDPRDSLTIEPLTDADWRAIAERWAAHGLDLLAFRQATTDEIGLSGSSWARRLGAGRHRQVWRLDLARPIGATVVPTPAS
ncbi:MAG: hypothetical protein H0U52_08475 [Chloroflexi bacterium]|nr:hypothetical protein [Chloroflexota bacterium]